MDISQTRIQELIKDLSHKNEDIRWGAAFALFLYRNYAIFRMLRSLDFSRDGFSQTFTRAEFLYDLRSLSLLCRCF